MPCIFPVTTHVVKRSMSDSVQTGPQACSGTVEMMREVLTWESRYIGLYCNIQRQILIPLLFENIHGLGIIVYQSKCTYNQCFGGNMLN